MFKYYLNNTEYQIGNEGDISFDINLKTDEGAYYMEYSINGKVLFENAAYFYIKQHAETQKILFSVYETCDLGTFQVFDNDAYFTHYDCEFDDEKKQVFVSVKIDSYYNKIKKAYDAKFNFLETPNIVSSTYVPDRSNYEYLYDQTLVAYATAFKGNWGTYVTCGGLSPTLGFALYVREFRTTYCQAGEPQEPIGTGWNLYIDNCFAKRTAKYFRKPDIFQDPAACSLTFADTNCATPCVPALPAGTNDWMLIYTYENPSITIGFWIDRDSMSFDQVDFINGRKLVDVLNYGLSKIDENISIQSRLLTDLLNPITSVSPSDLYELQIHSISDIKYPPVTNSERATRENTTVRTLLEGYVSSKLNAFWRVDERTKKVIIEHITAIHNSSSVFNLTSVNPIYIKNRNKYSFDKSDIPKNEVFPSSDNSIDFTGVDIEFNNGVSDGVKTYQTEQYYSEVESIYSFPEEYPQDGAVIITPNSLASPDFTGSPSGVRSENGAITNQYYPNAPQGMANLHNKYWGFWRPFANGVMNFIATLFTFNKPVKKAEEIEIPLCCFYLFDPYSKFKNSKYENGRLQSASFSPIKKTITLNIQYND